MADLTITATSVVSSITSDVETRAAGETIAAGQAVYLASGKWMLADSNSATAAARVAVGIALNGGAVNQPVTVKKRGSVAVNAVLTAGVGYYLSDTPGGICPVADVGSGEYPCFLGFAQSTTVLALEIQASPVAV